ncbi:MAG TPA: NAD(P)H-dependent glycerol-3-phosphate dehydrogenase [Pantanalinema sp.]
MTTPHGVSVIGGGSWGTTIAHLIGENGHPVKLWMRDPEQVAELNLKHRNERYLGDLALSPRVLAVSSLEEAARDAATLVIVTPSHSLRTIARELGDHLDGSRILIHGIKGLEPGTFKRMSQVLREETCCRKIGVLSGPNLAKEVAQGQPSATVVASAYQEVVEAGVSLLKSKTFRVYGNDDVVGTELGGTLKNIFAIAAGLAHGLGFGDNTKALLLTRGLTEMTRLGVHMGASVSTFSGLSGIGDLMATCFSPLSRNYQVGYRLSKGETLEAITHDLKQVAEGVRTTRTVADYARAKGLYLPITQGVARVLFEGATPQQALSGLLEVGRNPFETDAPDREISIL